MLAKISKSVRTLKIEYRFILLCIIIPILIIFGSFTLIYNISKQDVIDRTKSVSFDELNLIESNILLKFEKYNDCLDLMSNSVVVRNAIINKDKYNLNLYVASDPLLSTKSDFVAISDTNDEFIYSKVSNMNELDLSKLIDIPKSNVEDSVYILNDNDKKYITIIKEVNDSGSNIGYIYIGLEAKDFIEIYVNSKTYEVAILDANNKIIASTIYMKDDEIQLSNDFMHRNDIKYMQNYKKLAFADWKVLSLKNMDIMLSDHDNTWTTILILVLGFILVMTLLTRILYLSIIKPLKKLSMQLDGTIEGDFTIIEHVEVNDEIGEIGNKFNLLINKLEESIIDAKEQHVKKRETEIKMLQAQINPHFLFNTLGTLKAIALMNEDRSVAQGLHALAKLLRSTVINSDEKATIAEEIENLNNYVIIQKLRYGDTFDVIYEVDKKLNDYKIMKFLFQPIVENSILHAFEEDKDDQYIKVSVKKRTNNIYIVIEDNGCGYDINQKSLHNEKLSGIGMKNIKERLELTFGEHQSMNIKSEKGKGTKTTIKIPVMTD